ncbi:MAG: VOC family protein [Alphaproteobacteria bacterium]|nr:VOC family protein [Alphaproteobacteria bacterium]
MITALDSIKLTTADIATAATAMERLLGGALTVGEESATVHLANTSLDLALAEDGSEGLAGLAFSVENLDQALRVCERRALKPGAPVAFAETDATGLREGRHIDLDVAATFGVPISLIEYASPPSRPSNAGEGAINGLDHLVIRTTHPNRAAALYGARLGLDMRLDRTEPKWGARLMFFRAGHLIVEVVHNLAEEPSDAPDKLWGLSWRVANAEAAHARLKAEGFDISEIRTGRKPGTRVFTVRNNTLGVPTLIVA